MDEKWIIVSGIVERGHRVASGDANDNPYPSGTIKMQKPFFKELGLDLSAFYDGTLNISISPRTFSMKQPQYILRHVAWTTLHPPEDFSFSHCKVIFNSIEYDGWIYYPHPETKKVHFQNSSIVEIITLFIPNLKYENKVEIVINTNEVSLKRIRRLAAFSAKSRASH